MIFLIGFMGSGKSTIAVQLGERLALPVIEMDTEIEKQEGVSIKDMFSQKGEPFFRQKETELLQNIKADSVVSTGGGVVEREENLEAMNVGKVIYLQASWETICERLIGDTDRPLWRGEESEKKKKFTDRQSMYEQAADLTVEVDNRTPEEITEIILKRLKG
ncbi:shikimate kinase [Halobacillus litoralis]|uniref:shikimate kinase n=1 Tax=Halobacillus litoralis TaxID=45668 RepID=UPI001CD1B95D|nr:shikimate kinase [Halobacillus litoralis]MCA0970101.1 shikimate kinase [Halobacillus litoralis]